MCEWQHEYPQNWLCVLGDVSDVLDKWHHVAVTYDGSSSGPGFAIYLDGQPVPMKVTADNLSATVASATPVRIGGRDNGYIFDGALDDWRLYRRALSEQQVRQLYEGTLHRVRQIPDGRQNASQKKLLARLGDSAGIRSGLDDEFSKDLMAHFPFDEGEGRLAINVADESQEASCQFGTRSESVSTSGVVGNSVKLGAGVSIIVGEPLGFDSSDTFSYGCWFNSKLNGGFLISTRDKDRGHRGFSLYLSPKDRRLRASITGETPDRNDRGANGFSPHGIRLETTSSWRQSEWHHGFVTYDGSQQASGVKLFVDGQPVSATVQNDQLAGHDQDGFAPIDW